MIPAVATITIVLVYLYVPVGDVGLLFLGIPLRACSGPVVWIFRSEPWRIHRSMSGFLTSPFSPETSEDTKSKGWSLAHVLHLSVENVSGLLCVVACGS